MFRIELVIYDWNDIKPGVTVALYSNPINKQQNPDIDSKLVELGRGLGVCAMGGATPD